MKQGQKYVAFKLNMIINTEGSFDYETIPQGLFEFGLFLMKKGKLLY